MVVALSRSPLRHRHAFRRGLPGSRFDPPWRQPDDGPRRRVVKKSCTSGTLKEARDLYFSDRWQVLHQGLSLETAVGLYNCRNRVYSPNLGVWLQRDPLEYVDGMNLYEYVISTPLGSTDATGEGVDSLTIAEITNIQAFIAEVILALGNTSMPQIAIILLSMGISVAAIEEYDPLLADVARRILRDANDSVLDSIIDIVDRFSKTYSRLTGAAACKAAQAFKKSACGQRSGRLKGCPRIPITSKTNCSIFGQIARRWIRCAAARDLELAFCSFGRSNRLGHIVAAASAMASAVKCVLRGKACSSFKKRFCRGAAGGGP